MRTFILILFGLSLLVSCKKEEAMPRPTEIIFGDFEGKYIVDVSTFIGGNNLIQEDVSVDIDGDGEFDVRFVSGASMSSPSNSASGAWVESLHPNCKFLVEQIQDTTFFYETTQFSIDPASGQEILIQSKNYSCRKESLNYEPHALETRLLLNTKSVGEKISILDLFQSLSLPFSEINTSSFKPTGEVVQGVVYYDLTNRYNDCAIFPQDQLRYIGIMLYSPTGPKLGWIRVHSNKTYQLSVLETAIQN